MNRFRQRLFAWITALAMLLGALAPVAVQAVGMGGAERYRLEICSASGQHWITLSAEEARALGDSAATDQNTGGAGAAETAHCPFCCGHSATAGLPPSFASFAPPSGRSLLPELFYTAARPLFAWAAAQPRAPPRAAFPAA